MLLFIATAIVIPASDTSASAEQVASDATNQEDDALASSMLGESVAEPEPELPKLTGPQRNAVRTAEQYLSLTGFSRLGLIEQLSSSAGDGYERADATVAVDSLSVDWNENAVKSAKQYLNLMGFSCSGLIDQLSSDAGDKYTKSEATYGAEQAGAC